MSPTVALLRALSLLALANPLCAILLCLDFAWKQLGM
jgi:hypothetical protein